MPPDISSPANERIKWLVRLRDRRHRDEQGVFVVEGERLYRRALDSGLVPQVTFVATEAIPTVGETVTVEPRALDRASYRQRSEGLIAVFPQMDTSLGHIALPATPLVLVVEETEKPGNLGAILRTGGAAGVDAVVTVGGAVDAHNPNVVRASTGALFTTPLAVSTWDELAAWLGRHSMSVLAADPGTGAPMWDVDLTVGVALVLGAEDEGLSDRARDIAHHTITIPQEAAGPDSLNLSVAAAILLYEARRQRH